MVLLREAREFINALSQPARDKIYHNIYRVGSGEKDAELFKKLEGTDIWEFRTLFGGTAYRLFAFLDRERETLVVATHGFVKKTRKTPHKEIAIAKAIRDKYFSNIRD